MLALGSVVAVLTLLAGPASAQTSGGAVATDGSVASGEAHASRNSTASGESTAVNGSTASGCSTATNHSTASGDDSCERKAPPTTVRPPTGGGGGGATATAGRLALTGSWSTPMIAMAALAIAIGALLVVAGSDRRRASARA